MLTEQTGSEYRVHKDRIDAIITLANGQSAQGYFFVARASAQHVGPGRERVGELLNAEPGFFPFGIEDGDSPRTVLYNRRQVVMVALADNEARRDPDYDIAAERLVSVQLSNGQQFTGVVRVHRPHGRNRLSDWARHPDTFRYVETREMTLLVNIAHVVEVHEVPKA
jgi:hypothetical protein